MFGIHFSVTLLLLLSSGCLGTENPADILNNNFEKSLESWMDLSTSTVKWKIEQYSSSSVPPEPQDAFGSRYLRMKNPGPKSFGVAILRSPFVPVGPGDMFSFSYRVQSAWDGFNNLEVYYVREKEEVLMFSSFTSQHEEWETVSLPIPSEELTTTQFVIYGFCGQNSQDDFIAIDNIEYLIPIKCPEELEVGPSSEIMPCFVHNDTSCYCISTFSESGQAPDRIYNRAEGDKICRANEMEILSLNPLEINEEKDIILKILSDHSEKGFGFNFWASSGTENPENDCQVLIASPDDPLKGELGYLNCSGNEMWRAELICEKSMTERQ